MLRLAIVDDHQIVRRGFRDMLEGELDIKVEFEAATGEEALQQLREITCDVLLLDLSLPGQGGVDVLRTVRQRHPDLHVLILSGYPEDRYALSMIKSGAEGYLCKDCDRLDLLRAVRTVAQGRRYVSRKTAELLADELSGHSNSSPHESLSEREMQVFLRLARGESVTDIGRALHLSVKTISTYRTRLLEKLGVNSNAELAAYAIRNGLIAEYIN
jgi:two-component system, NarL family, invasion response regulator UvrY